MNLPDKIFKPERYTYNDYKGWEGNWELINGYPISMSPSPKRTHQFFGGKFFRLLGNVLEKEKLVCSCETYYELDWIVNDTTVVRPDCMVVCGDFKEDFLTFPPQLILEVSSPNTRLRDRNTKFSLYEMYGVKYYLIADCDKKIIEIFELINNKYKQTEITLFNLTPTCSINFDVKNLFY
jgi:Uma2 family endonuclease